MTRVRYRRNQELLMQTPPAIPEAFAPDIESARQVVKTALADGHSWLAEIEAKALLAAYGVPVVTTQVAANPEEAAAIAAGLNRPVSLKIQAANIRHKSDVGGVALYLETPAVVRENARMMWERIRTAYPAVELLGFTVQPMIHRPHAHELSIEVISDPQFGPVIRFGQGGPAADVIADQVLALPPLNMLLAREMLSRTRVYRLLRGYRDMPAVDLDAIALTLVKISQLVIDLAEVDALEINPLLADEQGVLALGTRIKVTRAVEPAAQRLLIRPYPKELEETLTLPDGRRLQLRPVRPEDEPALHAAFAKLSPEEIFMRFFHHMKSLTHAAAARYTQIDYDREMALVLVSQPAAGETELYGVVRIVADPDRERAEFAIIVGMAMTGMGLGPLLMRRVIDYARSRGIKELFGEVLSENEAMLKLSRALGFSIRPMPGDAELMQVSLKL
jgi:acetyltransferase